MVCHTIEKNCPYSNISLFICTCAVAGARCPKQNFNFCCHRIISWNLTSDIREPVYDASDCKFFYLIC